MPTEPYLAQPAIVGNSLDVTEGSNPAMTLAAVAVPAVTSIVISRLVDTVVNIIIPLDAKKERDNFYKHAHGRISKSKLPSNNEVNAGIIEPVVSVEARSDPKEWIVHVERAKEELSAAEQKVRCGKCKKDISEVKKSLESRTGEMVGNAKRHLAMMELKKKGKIPASKNRWKDLSEREKKLVKSVEV